MRTTILALAASALVSSVAGSPTARTGGDLAPLITPPAPDSDRVTIQGGGGADPEGHVVQDSYIIVFKDGTPGHHVVKHKAQVEELWARHATGLEKRGIRWDRLFRGLKHHFSMCVNPSPRAGSMPLTDLCP